MAEHNGFTMISLFAGAGGLDIGLEQAGFASVAVNELGPHACESLRQNKVLGSLSNGQFNDWFSAQIAGQKCYSRPDVQPLIAAMKRRLRSAAGKHSHLAHATIVEEDIRALSSDDLMARAAIKKGEVFLIAGGPPCQPFSRAGKRETVETGDGRLFLEFVRMVDEIKPRWFLFENVKGLAQSKTVVPFTKCSKCQIEKIIPFMYRERALEGSGVPFRCSVCDCATLSVATRELRGGSLDIILSEFEAIGYTCSHDILNSADFGVPQNRERLFIVGSRDGEHFSWPTPTHRDPTSTPEERVRQLDIFQELPTPRKRKPWVSVKDVLWRDGHPEFGKLDYDKAVLWVKNVVRPHDEPVTWKLDRVSPTVGAHQGAKLALAPYGVPDEQLARQQWHVLGKRQRDLPPVPVVHAMLTDEELLRLQTFPVNWYLHGTRMERAFQIGNAVPPLLAKAVGEAIIQASQTSQETTKTFGRYCASNTIGIRP